MGTFNELSRPFDPSDLEWYVGMTTQDKTRGLALPFITNRAVQDRLDEVCGIDGWRNEYKALKEADIFDRDGTIKGKKFSYLCGISVWNEDRREWITKWDGAEETDIESLKGGLSSAMKRSAVQWGIGRYLYYLDSPWVEIEKKGNSYIIKANQELILPSWALPGGKGRPMAGDSRQVTVKAKGSYPSTESPQQTGQPSTGQPGQPSTGQIKTLSDKQVQRALKKAEAAGQSLESVILWIEKKYGTSEIKNLNRQQYDELCDALDNARQ